MKHYQIAFDPRDNTVTTACGIRVPVMCVNNPNRGDYLVTTGSKRTMKDEAEFACPDCLFVIQLDEESSK